MKKLSFTLCLLCIAFLYGCDSEPVLPEIPDTPIHAFVSQTCPHCTNFKEFMSQWENAPEVTYYEVSEKGSQIVFDRLMEKVSGLMGSVPTIFINGQVMQGFSVESGMGDTIRETYQQCSTPPRECMSFADFIDWQPEPSSDVLSFSLIPKVYAQEAEAESEVFIDEGMFTFDLWFFGKTDLRDLSLPVLSIVLGGLDGFNPCAMWVLITLLTLLINTRSWPRIIMIGSTFLIVSGAMYYLFIAAWLNAFLLIGYNEWVQKIIGIIAICGGSYYLYEAFGKDPNQCKVTNLSQRQRTIERMKKVVAISSWPLMVMGVGILAISVNMIELVCSAGLPAIFTQILAYNDISVLAKHGYLLLYILAYMADDLIIYIIAVATLHATGLTTKYQRISFIFGGVLMAGLGILLIFYPQALTFG